jgi:hypothetical protein
MIKPILFALILTACSGTTEHASPALDCTSPGDKTDMVMVLTQADQDFPECTEITDPRFVMGPGRYWCCEKGMVGR